MEARFAPVELRDQVQVAVRAATGSARALASETNPLARPHAFGNRDVELAVGDHAAGAMTDGTDPAIDDARSAAARTRVLNLQIDLFGAALIRVAQAQFDRCLEIATAPREAGRPARSRLLLLTDSREECIEEIGEAARSRVA